MYDSIYLVDLENEKQLKIRFGWVKLEREKDFSDFLCFFIYEGRVFYRKDEHTLSLTDEKNPSLSFYKGTMPFQTTEFMRVATALYKIIKNGEHEEMKELMYDKKFVKLFRTHKIKSLGI